MTNPLIEYLHSYGVRTTLLNRIEGPQVIRYVLKLAPGTRLRKVAALEPELSYRYGAAVTVTAPLPHLAECVAIDVPRGVPQRIKVEDPSRITDGRLPMDFGVCIDGSRLQRDLASLPHLLIAGETGSGKSTLLHTLIHSLMCRRGAARLFLVDPKMVEFPQYEGDPSIGGIATDPWDVLDLLDALLDLMANRFELMASAGVQDIAELTTRVPYQVLIVDELADLMMSDGRADAERAICRLAQKGRAAGIHLILATQTPRVQVITGMIKANMPARVALRVPTMVDSRVILDRNGAEKLLGAGDALLSMGGEIVRFQSARVPSDVGARIAATPERMENAC